MNRVVVVAALWALAALVPRRKLWAGVAILLTIVVVYSPSLQYGFVTDDFYFARPLSGAELLSTFWGNWEPHGLGNAHYRPVIALSLALDYSLWGPLPWGYHLTNLILLWLVGLVGFNLLYALLESFPGALLGSLAWVAHPLSATAAAWSNQRTDSIMALFYLAALLLLARPRFSAATALGVLCCGALALGSKEMAATLPMTGALLIAVVPLERRRDRLFTVGGLALLAVVHAIAWMQLFPTKAHLGSPDPLALLPGLLAPVFVPTSYDAWWDDRSPVLTLLAASFLLLALWWLVRRWGSRQASRAFGCGLLWPFLTLAPVFGLRDPDVFRLGLLVSFGFALLAGAAFAALGERSAPRVALAAGLAFLMAPLTMASAAAWGPDGFMYQQGTRWKIEDRTWEARLTPEMRSLFRSQAESYLADRAAARRQKRARRRHDPG